MDRHAFSPLLLVGKFHTEIKVSAACTDTFDVMVRKALHSRHWKERARPFLAPASIGLVLTLVSTAAFIYTHRNDLLILMAQQRHAPAVQALVSLGATARYPSRVFSEPALIEYLHSVHEAPKHPHAARALATALLRAGAEVDQRNASGWTPLMLAASAGHLELVELLIRHGAEVDARGFGADPSEGLTALMAAAMHGHAEVVTALMDRGANPHLRSRSGFTALLLAASRGQTQAALALIEKGAAVAPASVQVAERNGHGELAQVLSEALDRSPKEIQARRPARFPEE